MLNIPETASVRCRVLQPGIDGYGPPFGDQDARVFEGHVEGVADAHLREVDAIHALSQLSNQTDTYIHAAVPVPATQVRAWGKATMVCEVFTTNNGYQQSRYRDLEKHTSLPPKSLGQSICPGLPTVSRRSRGLSGVGRKT